jgi:membrane protein implicated in regulation of membrane protease activity
MSDTSASPGRRTVITPSRVMVGLCLIAPFVAMTWVGSYAKVDPAFIGIPFFYWYQMLWVPISAVLTMTAYALVRRERRALREAREPQAPAEAHEGGTAE